MNRRPQLPFSALATLAIVIGIVPASCAMAQTVGSPKRMGAQPFVSVGKLIRSGQSRDGTPRFALLDDEGAVTAYVLPTAGINLGQYTNQQVGVTARSLRRGGDSLPQILAQQVSPLGGDEEPHTGAVEGSGFAAEESAPSTEHRKSRGSKERGGPTDEPRILPELEATLIQPSGGSSETIVGVSLEDLMGESADTVVPAAAQMYEEVIEPPAGVPLDASGAEFGGVMLDEGAGQYEYGWDGVDYGGCSGCSSCNPCGVGCTPCGPWGRRWIRLQYLAWKMKGMSLPPLVTSSPGSTPIEDAGVLGLSTTNIIYGYGDVLDDVRNGLRLQAGTWLDPCQWWGLELDLFGLERKSDDFRRGSHGSPVLARPFYNALLNVPDAELVAYPGVLSGVVSVHADSRLYWVAPRFRMNLRCADHLPYPALACTGCDPCGGAVCAPPGGYRLDMLLGYRYLRLDESLQIHERLNSTLDVNESSFDLWDSFDTENRLHGIELGLSWEAFRGPWSLELMGLFVLGQNRRSVDISGRTTSSALGVSFTDPGGLLALPSNMGSYKDDQFVVIPELGITAGYAIAPNLRLLLGYSALYWGNVARPGGQIDLRVNPDLLPPEQPTLGPRVPRFVLTDTNFWAQGLNLGLDWRW